MKIRLFFALMMLLSTQAFAYPQIPGTGSTASQDVVSASSDTYSVGVNSNVWRNGYFSNVRMKANPTAPALDSGFGAVYVKSTDNELYYQNASTGAETQISATVAGDVSQVGDCVSGACFTSTNGNQNLYFGTVPAGNKTRFLVDGPTADRTITIPDSTGRLAVKASSPINLSTSGDLTIVDLGILSSKIANDTISGDKLVAGSIGNDRIGSGTILNSNIQVGTVSADKLAALSIGNDKIANTTITSGKIQNDAIGPTQLDETANYAWTGQQDSSSATFLKIPAAASPTVDAAGKVAQDTTDNQLLFGAAPEVLIAEKQICVNDMDAVSTDDHIVFWTANKASTVTRVGCHYEGEGTVAQFQLMDGGYHNMTHAAPTCVSGDTSVTYQDVTANNALSAGEGLAFSITNNPTSATGDYVLCAAYKTDRS